MDKNVLALDLSFAGTGWAFTEMTDGLWEDGIGGGIKRFPLVKGQHQALRFHSFNYWLKEALDDAMPDLVVYERAHQRGRGATECAIGLSTRVEEACAIRGIKCRAVHSLTIKKWATGNGHADKLAMQEAAASKVAWYQPEDDPGADLADALCLLLYTLDETKPAPKVRAKKKRKAKAPVAVK